ncbi:MAG TPA: magnesium/cobalt transporter CorA [Kofleriaceae bacterium]|nr:magnesium/cobalt transporter CorA [Kofleriaceae bacterium]
MLARILEGKDGLAISTDAHEIFDAIKSNKTVWVELERKTDEADQFLVDLGIHPLTIEDIWGPTGHPKIDDFPNYLYIVIQGVTSAKKSALALAELDVLIGPNWLVTHDRDGVVADDLGTELDHSTRLLQKGAAWLAHAVLDRAVDRYMPIIDQLDTEIDALENDVLEKAGTPRGRGVLTRILAFKRLLQTLRRMSIHQRELLLRLSRGEYEEIPPEALPFYRDVYDHFLRIQEIAEGYRDLVTSSLDAYLSVQSNRMNEIMKTLTLMSTVMLPLTFIAGVYGMNFDHMPELHWFWGYPFALCLMGGVAAVIFVFFKYKGYIGSDPALRVKPKKPKKKSATERAGLR